MDSTSEAPPGSKLVSGSIGRPGFATRHGLGSSDRDARAAEIAARIRAEGIETVRFSFVDAHGQLRTRPIEARHFEEAARNGVPFTTAVLAMDSGNFIFQPVFSEDGGFGHAAMGGAGDMLGLADLDTFRVLPWAHKTASVLTDLYLSNGDRCPFDPRTLMRSACSALSDRGLAYVGGVEIECHIFRIEDARLSLSDAGQPATPPDVAIIQHGYQHLSELVFDGLESIVTPIRQVLIDLGLPLRTVEGELGPGQLEITLDPLIGLEAADAVVLLRSAIKQVMRRRGFVVTFMAKPGLPNVYSSGWHLHQSLAQLDGSGNAFTSPDKIISDLGRNFVGGVLAHVAACTAFSNPSINGYKRINANALAPKRAVWSVESRAAMCRLIGGAGDTSTHIENRSGEPLANPYLYMASQIFAGLDGIENAIDPGEPLHDPYSQTSQPLLPTTLAEAVTALDNSPLFRKAFGGPFVDHFVAMKRHEIGRFHSYVTDWEQREYFELF